MKLNPNAFGLSVGAISAVGAFICGFFFGLWPSETMSFVTLWFHTDLSGLAVKVTALSFISSIVITFIAAYVFAWLVAVLYNRLAKE